MLTTNDTSRARLAPSAHDAPRECLAQILRTARDETEIDVHAVHGAVTHYVRQLRAADIAPERVLIMVKDVARTGCIPG